MALENINNVHTLRGTLIMVAGLALLLHTLGLIEQGLSFFLGVVALCAIIYGLYIGGFYAKIRAYMHRNHPSKQ